MKKPSHQVHDLVPSLINTYSCKYSAQFRSGRSDVINGFELLAHGLRRFCELAALFSSDTLNFCQASVLHCAMKLVQVDSVIVVNICFSVLGREFVHISILMQR